MNSGTLIGAACLRKVRPRCPPRSAGLGSRAGLRYRSAATYGNIVALYALVIGLRFAGFRVARQGLCFAPCSQALSRRRVRLSARAEQGFGAREACSVRHFGFRYLWCSCSAPIRSQHRPRRRTLRPACRPTRTPAMRWPTASSGGWPPRMTPAPSSPSGFCSTMGRACLRTTASRGAGTPAAPGRDLPRRSSIWR